MSYSAKERPTRECRFCGEVFSLSVARFNQNQHFCGKSCSAKAKRKAPLMCSVYYRTCPECSTQFATHRPHKSFCSPACKGQPATRAKVCSVCSATYTLPPNNRGDLSPLFCSQQCRSAARRAYTRAYVEANRAEFKATKNAILRRNRTFVRACKSKPCTDCGKCYHHEVMEYDHVVGKKAFSISTARSVGLDRLRAEIDKCELVCANCHRMRHVRRKEIKLSA